MARPRGRAARRGFWRDLASEIDKTKRGPDFITIDGGEGGTGAGPLAFTDHVAMPFKPGFAQVYRIFAEAGVHHRVVFIGSGKLGFPETALLGLALGCDMINVAREAMMSIGCIQAQRCHTGHCPTGVATQNRWLMHGLDPTLKSARLANYFATLRRELIHLAHACGHAHPALLPLDQLDIITSSAETRSASTVYGYQPGWGLPPAADADALRAARAARLIHAA